MRNNRYSFAIDKINPSASFKTRMTRVMKSARGSTDTRGAYIRKIALMAASVAAVAFGIFFFGNYLNGAVPETSETVDESTLESDAVSSEITSVPQQEALITEIVENSAVSSDTAPNADLVYNVMVYQGRFYSNAGTSPQPLSDMVDGSAKGGCKGGYIGKTRAYSLLYGGFEMSAVQPQDLDSSFSEPLSVYYYRCSDGSINPDRLVVAGTLERIKYSTIMECFDDVKIDCGADLVEFLELSGAKGIFTDTRGEADLSADYGIDDAIKTFGNAVVTSKKPQETDDAGEFSIVAKSGYIARFKVYADGLVCYKGNDSVVLDASEFCKAVGLYYQRGTAAQAAGSAKLRRTEPIRGNALQK